jgi:hypothetical protein
MAPWRAATGQCIRVQARRWHGAQFVLAFEPLDRHLRPFAIRADDDQIHQPPIVSATAVTTALARSYTALRRCRKQPAKRGSAIRGYEPVRRSRRLRGASKN